MTEYKMQLYACTRMRLCALHSAAPETTAVVLKNSYNVLIQGRRRYAVGCDHFELGTKLDHDRLVGVS